MNAREKGQMFCSEVKKILEGIGHEVDGPFSKSKWPHLVHCDIFGIFDLVSYFEGSYFFHQVSTLHNKSTKINAILNAKKYGWVWSRVSNGRIFYRVFIVKSSGEIEEAEIRWKV